MKNFHDSVGRRLPAQLVLVATTLAQADESVN